MSADKLDVIRKLLTKAERAATPDEADAYNTKAAQLMAKHGVDNAMLAAAGANTRDVISRRYITMSDPYSTEKAILVSNIAYEMSCRSVCHTGPGRGQTSAVTVMGFESDLARVDLAYTSLLLQATRGVLAQRPPSWSNESTAAFRRTWLDGFTTEVTRRLALADRIATQQHDTTTKGPSAALVLADRRGLVEQALQDAFTGLRTARPRRLTGTGFHAGVQAGRQADVGHAQVGHNRPEIDRRR